MKNKRITIIAKEFNISQPTIKKYINMSEDDIRSLDNPTDYKKGEP